MRNPTPILALLVIAVIPTQSQAAVEYVVEAPAIEQIVKLSADDVGRPDRMPIVEKRVRAAAKAVCDSQYRGETLYRVVHLCVTGSTADGLRQYSDLRARQSRSGPSVGSLALVIRATAQ